MTLPALNVKKKAHHICAIHDDDQLRAVGMPPPLDAGAPIQMACNSGGMRIDDNYFLPEINQ
jgi:hypothetical protein